MSTSVNTVPVLRLKDLKALLLCVWQSIARNRQIATQLYPVRWVRGGRETCI